MIFQKEFNVRCFIKGAKFKHISQYTVSSMYSRQKPCLNAPIIYFYFFVSPDNDMLTCLLLLNGNSSLKCHIASHSDGWVVDDVFIMIYLCQIQNSAPKSTMLEWLEFFNPSTLLNQCDLLFVNLTSIPVLKSLSFCFAK